ncbi:MAG: Lrp/AsnC family transcriptional regulator [Candidatus Bilamarchaeaceae archaeon]
MDETDKRILGFLKANSRMRNIEIARHTSLTEGAVRHRIEKLVSLGVIQRFTIETTEGSFYGVAMLKARGSTKTMMKQVSSSGVAKEIYEIFGEFDGCAIIEGVSLDDVDRKIDVIRRLHSVQETRTFVSAARW